MSYIIIKIDRSCIGLIFIFCESRLPSLFRICSCRANREPRKSKREYLLRIKSHFFLQRSQHRQQSFLLLRQTLPTFFFRNVHALLFASTYHGDKSHGATLAKCFNAIRGDDVLTQKYSFQWSKTYIKKIPRYEILPCKFR